MNNTMATMDAAASVDSDMEKALWSETPETNYFKMMMEDNEAGRIADSNDNTDDSVLGGETLASMMGDVNNPKKASNGNKAKHSTTSADAGRLPAETMSIVGLEDDVSTIANDTINETTKSFFTGTSDRQESKPRLRLFKEYITTEKAKKRIETSTQDEETAPGTPPGMIQVPGKSDKDVDEGGGKAGKEANPLARSKRMYILAGVLAVVLCASIVALSVALSGMRDDDGSTSTSTSSSSSENTDNADSGNILDDWPELNATINKPSDPPIADGEELDPTDPPLDTPDDESATEAPVSTTPPTENPVESEFTFRASLAAHVIKFSAEYLTTLDFFSTTPFLSQF